MTVEDLRVLVDNLDEYIHIPGGIDRLKKTVLHLAVSGQLVPQDASEGTGAELYKVIQTTKAKLIGEGKLKKAKPFPPITADETPFAIPGSWEWVRTGDIILQMTGGGTPSKAEPKFWGGDIPWASIKDLNVDTYINDTQDYITEAGCASKANLLKPAGSIFIGTRMGVGKIAISTRDMAINQDLKAIQTDSLDKLYFVRYFKTAEIKGTAGTTVAGITQDKLLELLFPLPPLAEQKRIVAKVDEIFALIDRLSVAYQAEETERSAFVRSSLRSLSHDGSQLALENLASTIRTKADSEQLRKAILHLAVSGQLVPQDSTEGTGAELYKVIQTTKAKLVSVGELKKAKPLPSVTPEETPFAIPASWEWVRLPEIYRNIPPVTKLKTDDYLENGKYPIVDQGQRYIAGYTNGGELNKVTTPVTIFGDHTREIKLVDFDFIVGADGVKILEPIEMNSDFFYTLIDVFRPQSRGYGRHFRMLNEKIVPLPPLAEQTRIVAKTTHLLNLVTELEKNLEK